MALSYGLSLNQLLVSTVQLCCMLENDMISLERLNQYMCIPGEAPEVIDGNRPIPSWPAVGRVEIHDLEIRYMTNTLIVLQGISCTFEGGTRLVLGKCQLREYVQEKEGGLDSLVQQDGVNWSMGQRQLFFLGRALLRRSHILVFEEATSSIDNATYSILQKTIQTEFASYTVITVAHRIPTVMDSTMVLAISDGKIIEYAE